MTITYHGLRTENLTNDQRDVLASANIIQGQAYQADYFTGRLRQATFSGQNEERNHDLEKIRDMMVNYVGHRNTIDYIVVHNSP